MLAAFLALGATAGFLAGLLGIGGGVVLVPGLYYLLSALGYDDPALMHVAVGTSLAIIIPTGLSSALAHRRRGNVRGDLLLSLGPGVLVGVMGGALLADALSGESLKTVFAFCLLGLSILMLADPSRVNSRGEFFLAQPFGVGLAGLLIGAVSSLIGIGGATLSVPYMVYHRVSMHKAVGTASALGLVIAIPATIAYSLTGLDEAVTLPWTVGYINFLAWVAVIPASTLVAPLGAALAGRLSVRWLRVVFALFILGVAGKMIYEAFFA